MPLDPTAIRTRAQELGLNGTELAARAGLTAPALSRLLAGGRPDPRLSTVERLAAALETSVSQIIGSARCNAR
jgi:HTH-type transcriptional regulator / antitoxin HipB